MAIVYSRKLAAGTINAGVNNNVYTVPAGTTTIVRDIEVADVLALAGLILITQGGIWIASFTGTAAQYASYQWTGRVVLNAGDVINVDAVSSDWTYRISGYELV